MRDSKEITLEYLLADLADIHKKIYDLRQKLSAYEESARKIRSGAIGLIQILPPARQEVFMDRIGTLVSPPKLSKTAPSYRSILDRIKQDPDKEWRAIDFFNEGLVDTQKDASNHLNYLHEKLGIIDRIRQGVYKFIDKN